MDRLRQAYHAVRDRRPFETVVVCILPDHLHAIWALPRHDRDFSTRWSLIKSGFSRGLDAKPRSKSKSLKREKGIWQRRYWEHTIRDDADLERHIDYIHFNPVKHGYVCARRRLAAQQLSPLCRTRMAHGRLGRRHEGHSRIVRGMKVGTLRFARPTKSRKLPNAAYPAALPG